MPPALQPIDWRVVDACRAAIAAMTKAAYFYPPTLRSDGTVAVAVVEPPLLMYLENQPSSIRNIYGVWSEGSEVADESGLGANTFLRSVTIEAYVRHQPAHLDQFDQDTPAEQVRTQLLHDIRKVIELEQGNQGGDMLGGLAELWFETSAEHIFAGEFGLSGWVGVQVETTLNYHTNLGDPTAQGQSA